MDSWIALHERIKAIVDEGDEPIDAATLKNALELLAFAESICPIPQEVLRGLWPTIRIVWDGFELEVFDSSVEFYRFMDGQTDIREYPRSPGATFPAGLVADLKMIRAQDLT